MRALNSMSGFENLLKSTLGAANEFLFLFLDPEARRIIREIGKNRDERPPGINELQTFVQLGIEVRNEGNHHVGIGCPPAIFEHTHAWAMICGDSELQDLQKLSAAERPAGRQHLVVEVLNSQPSEATQYVQPVQYLL